ncbi:MAG: hypothetical protein GY727_04395 [Gammaproteobacteria bacterium]|nr:hypothetical protein [Gammaproteobacteria bacterium]MCP4090081.1 hypothetical protein [Gammaproteobacteria bacterium]MCP4277029.1 hypothetical protein [Gammaproteobacteria bacterium]MCP4832748.1 hypothetical protein [Gammaproteobacteria bacterium]MCP4929941.1 hypothetical protein [Gammaproteobacteria bacterium]
MILEWYLIPVLLLLFFSVAIAKQQGLACAPDSFLPGAIGNVEEDCSAVNGFLSVHGYESGNEHDDQGQNMTLIRE